MPSTTRTLLSALAGAASVLAHGHVDNIVINGVSYAGYDVTTLPYESDPPVVVGWATDATDNGYVAPDAYGSGDIICHRNGTNAKGHAQVAAGESIYIQWTAWPDSHKGPVMDYLASCGDSCETVDKTTLEFFKIDEVGLVDGSTVPGTYGDDELIANGNGWLVEIPTNIKPGFYVLRHEIIALHSAENTDGAQNYPQCFNLEITGSGTEQPSGVLGTELYKETDAGILFNIYTTVTSYPVPGPTVISGASAVSQTSSAIASSGTPTTGSALATGGAAAGTTAAATPAATSAAATSAAVVVETSAAAVSTPAVVSTPAAVSTPVVVSTPAAVETTAAPAEAASTTVVAAQPTSTRVSCSKKKRRHARDVAVIAA